MSSSVLSDLFDVTLLPLWRGKAINDLTGRNYGRLTVRGFAGSFPYGNRGKHRTAWRCICVCGNQRIVHGELLKNGRTASCGCLQKDSVVVPIAIGATFGMWSIVARATNKINADGGAVSMWECLCACGERRIVSGSNLWTGKSKSCGCRTGENLIGQRFGKYLVIDGPQMKGGHKYWECRCDCGGSFSVYAGNLKRGLSKQCLSCSGQLDLIGKRFGKLVVVSRTTGAKGGGYWLCKCDCGGEKVVLCAILNAGRVISCGCAPKQTDKPFMTKTARDKSAVKRHQRRALKVAAGGSFTIGDIADIRRMQKDRCAEPSCRVKLKGGGHRDHIISLFRGGSNDRRNIQLLCGPCNQSKHAKDPIIWAQSKGRLL